MPRKVVTPAVVGYLILAGGVGFSLARVESQSGKLTNLVHQVEENSANQLANRVSNVHTWCTAVNQGRDEARRRARIQKPHVDYKLKDLDCKALEAGTATSAKK